MSLTKATYSMISGAVANVLDFGADSTGVADSTAAINAALTASRNVFFPSGTYNYSGELNLVGNTVIEGIGAEESTINFTNASADCIVFEDLNLVIRDISIVGGLRGIRVGDQAGGDSTAGREILLEKVYFVNNAGIGIDIQYGWSNYFKEVKIFNPGSNCIRFGTGFINTMRFEGIRTTDAGSPYTVLFNSSTCRSVEFDNCIFEGNDNVNSRAFYSDTGSSLVGVCLNSCYFETHTGYFIDFSNTSNYGVSIDKCSFVGDIIAINGPSGYSITNSTFTGDAGYFISNPVNSIVLNCGARTSGGAWSTKALFGGAAPAQCLIYNTGDDSPEQIGMALPANVNIGPTRTVDTSLTETIATASTGSFLVIGTRGVTGSGIFLANAGSGTATSIGTTGTFAGTLAWSGTNLQGTSPAAGSVTWYVMKF